MTVWRGSGGLALPLPGEPGLEEQRLLRVGGWLPSAHDGFMLPRLRRRLWKSCPNACGPVSLLCRGTTAPPARSRPESDGREGAGQGRGRGQAGPLRSWPRPPPSPSVCSHIEAQFLTNKTHLQTAQLISPTQGFNPKRGQKSKQFLRKEQMTLRTVCLHALPVFAQTRRCCFCIYSIESSNVGEN